MTYYLDDYIYLKKNDMPILYINLLYILMNFQSI